MKALNFILMVLLVGCGNYKNLKTNPTPPASKQDFGPQVEASQLTFDNIKQKVLDKHCTTCHQHKTAYQRYGLVKLGAVKMLERMVTSNTRLRMPQNAPPLSQDLINLFAQWVEAGAPETFNSDSRDPDTQKPIKEKSISFEQIKTQILDPYKCTTCHSQYKDYQVVRENLTAITSSILNGRMPYGAKINTKGPSVPSELKDLIDQWASQGAPEFNDGSSRPFTPQQLEPTWISLRNQLFGPKCILCHNSYGGQSRGDGLALDTYMSFQDQLKKNPKFLNFDSPNDSHLIGAIISRFDDDEFYFNTMPYSTSSDDVKLLPEVTKQELEMIKKWIGLKIPFNAEEL